MKNLKRMKQGRRPPLVHRDSNEVVTERDSLSSELNHEGLSRSLQFMAQNYTRPIQLDDIVTASGMSRRGLVKAFNKHVGRSPGAFMRQARIEFAKRPLTKLDLSVKTIALIAGFRSENTFCIAFSRATGMAPKKFQREAWLSVYRSVGSQQLVSK